jgi:two-component system, NarL family, response regulator NreC
MKRRALRILIVDDHEVVRIGIKLMLAKQNSFTAIIEEASDGEEAISMVEESKFDVILLDINLPKRDGLNVARYLINKNPAINILVLTMHKEDYIIKQMVNAGVRGYVLKNTGLEELVKAIITVSTSLRYYSNEVSQSLITGSPKEQQTASGIPQFSQLDDTLTLREKEIIWLIANEYTATQIGEKLFLSKKTIDFHRKNIFAKLELKSIAGIVRYAIQNGIV